MPGIQELKEIIKSLPEDDHIQLRTWFSDRDWQIWDEQIYEDSTKGKLDFLIREAEDEKRNTPLKELSMH